MSHASNQPRRTEMCRRHALMLQVCRRCLRRVWRNFGHSATDASLCRGFAPTAFGLPPGVVVARFHREPLKTWRDRLRRLYPATATRCPIMSGASPLRPLAYPRPLAAFVLPGPAKRGGIGVADFIPPPRLGGRVVPGCCWGFAPLLGPWRPCRSIGYIYFTTNAERRTPNAERWQFNGAASPTLSPSR